MFSRSSSRSSSSSCCFCCCPLQMKHDMRSYSQGVFTNTWVKERKARPPTQSLPPALQQPHPLLLPPLQHNQAQAAPPPPSPVLQQRRRRRHSFPRPLLGRRPEALWSRCIPVDTLPSFVRCRSQVQMRAVGCRQLQTTLHGTDFPFQCRLVDALVLDRMEKCTKSPAVMALTVAS